MHPADAFHIQARILDHVLDIPNAADVLVRKQPPPRACPVGDDETFVLVSADRRHGEADPAGKRLVVVSAILLHLETDHAAEVPYDQLTV